MPFFIDKYEDIERSKFAMLQKDITAEIARLNKELELVSSVNIG